MLSENQRQQTINVAAATSMATEISKRRDIALTLLLPARRRMHTRRAAPRTFACETSLPRPRAPLPLGAALFCARHACNVLMFCARAHKRSCALYAWRLFSSARRNGINVAYIMALLVAAAWPIKQAAAGNGAVADVIHSSLNMVAAWRQAAAKSGEIKWRRKSSAKAAAAWHRRGVRRGAGSEIIGGGGKLVTRLCLCCRKLASTSVSGGDVIAHGARNASYVAYRNNALNITTNIAHRATARA